jgi:NTE family protein
MKVGLVLGGGGVVGMAYHAAALAALEHELGWDPRTADVVVGTSAGSVVGALLRRGVPASDLATITVGAEPRSSPPGMARALSERPEFPPVRLSSFLVRPPRIPSPALVTAWLRRPWRLDPVSALAAVIPDGRLDLAEHASALEEILGSPWPDAALWVCTVRKHDLRRIVMGRDMVPRLAAAVAASCAIPGYFRPVDVEGQSYIDGGVRSPTNADVLRRADLDLAIILSPMSGRALPSPSVGSVVRRHARGKVEAERAKLEAAGIETLLVEPGPEVIRALGQDFMSHARVNDIVLTAFPDTGDQLRQPQAQARLRGLVEGRRPT